MDPMLVFKMYSSLVFELKDKLKGNRLLSTQETDKNIVSTTIVQGLVRFVKQGEFLKQKSNCRVKTSPQMTAYPPFVLSLPHLNPLSQQWKQKVKDVSGLPRIDDAPSHQHEFMQATSVSEFLKFALDRESLPELGLENVDLENLRDTRGAKLLVAGNDNTMYKFLQEFASA